MLPIKNNLAQDTTGLAYSLANSANGGAAVVVWESEPVTVTADDAMGGASQIDDERSEREDAKDWLRRALTDEPMDAAQVLAEAKENGYGAKAVRSAAKALGVKKAKRSFAGGWQWSLPAAEEAREDAQDTPP